MDNIQQIVSPKRADSILLDIQKWHEEYIIKHNIESDELKKKILQIKLDNVLYNLKKNNNLQGNLAIQTPSEIDPNRWKDMIQLQEYENNSHDNIIETDMFQCSRCNSKRCTYFTLQTRSCDEGETQFITCLECNKRWKQ